MIFKTENNSVGEDVEEKGAPAQLVEKPWASPMAPPRHCMVHPYGVCRTGGSRGQGPGRVL